jgi:antitoxin MazE
MQVSKWGNSLAIRLPSAVVKALNLKAGDDIEIRALDAGVVGVLRNEEREAAILRLRSLRGSLPLDYKFDRDEANAR